MDYEDLQGEENPEDTDASGFCINISLENLRTKFSMPIASGPQNIFKKVKVWLLFTF